MAVGPPKDVFTALDPAGSIGPPLDVFAEPQGGGSGTGTVTSINVSGGTTGITTTGGPITTSGTITLHLANNVQLAGRNFAGTGDVGLICSTTDDAIRIGMNLHLDETSQEHLLLVSDVTNADRGFVSRQIGDKPGIGQDNGPRLVTQRAQGTGTDPVESGNTLCVISAQGYDGATYCQPAGIKVKVTGAVSTNVVPAMIEFFASSDPDVFTDLPARMSISSAGNVVIASADSGSTLTAAGLHYPEADGTAGKAVVTDGSANLSLGYPTGALIGIQRITSTGAYTYTPTTGTKSVIVELQGGGGGGAAVAQPGSSNSVVGCGGGGGGWLRKRLTTNFSGATGVVGAKGAGGAAGANDGNDGGNTTFISTTPTTYTASGGNKGNGRTTGTPPLGYGSVAGGTASGGDDNQSGSPSGNAFSQNSNGCVGGAGGASRYSGGALSGQGAGGNVHGPGVNADGKGGGGSGAACTGTGADAAGGDGSDGMVIIWEYA